MLCSSYRHNSVMQFNHFQLPRKTFRRTSSKILHHEIHFIKMLLAVFQGNLFLGFFETPNENSLHNCFEKTWQICWRWWRRWIFRGFRREGRECNCRHLACAEFRWGHYKFIVSWYDPARLTFIRLERGLRDGSKLLHVCTERSITSHAQLPPQSLT